ncbi:hypothetical protein FACS1894184_05570 [Clostridia bacterium]|nr:hypothetical protein FACS1894184_05570 [Clostridia bacterium]
MSEQLTEYASKSAGFQQLIDRHGLVNASPKVRSEYFTWVDEQMLHDREIVKQRREGIEIGRSEGLGIGRSEGIGIGEQRGLEKAALNAIKSGIFQPSVVAAIGDITLDRAKELIAQYAQK